MYFDGEVLVKKKKFKLGFGLELSYRPVYSFVCLMWNIYQERSVCWTRTSCPTGRRRRRTGCSATSPSSPSTLSRSTRRHSPTPRMGSGTTRILEQCFFFQTSTFFFSFFGYSSSPMLPLRIYIKLY